MNTAIRTVSFSLLALSLAVVARAQFLDPSARAFSFQARLSGPGIPQNGTVDLVINIYRTPGGQNVVSGPHNLPGSTIAGGVVSEVIENVDAGPFDGSELWLGVRVNGGAELTPRVPLIAVPYALRVDRVGSQELDDNISLGSPSANGRLEIHGGSVVAEGGLQVPIDIGGGSLASVGRSGFPGSQHGVFAAFDESGDRVALMGNPFSGGTGGLMLLYPVGLGGGPLPGTGTVQLFGDGGNNAGQLTLGRVICDPFCRIETKVILDGADANGGGRLEMFDMLGNRTIQILADSNNQSDSGALISTFNANGDFASLVGTSLTGVGMIELFQNGQERGVAVAGDAPGLGGGGWLRLFDAAASETVDIRGNAAGAGTGGYIGLNRVGGQTGIVLLGRNPSGDGGYMEVRNAAEQPTVIISGDLANGDAWLTLRNGTTEAISMAARSGQFGVGGLIDIKNDAGQNTVRLIGDTGGGFGRVVTSVLEITGGADLAEPFDVANEAVEPGMVVVIDPANPGQLKLSTTAYDRKVAGVVSGAGGVQPGMIMAQKGTLAGGEHNVALTGRVYCWCDTSNGPIVPGDLLTTSATPGHAMKVSDHPRAQGAIIGKAMTSLDEGHGLVLVLVSLQ